MTTTNEAASKLYGGGQAASAAAPAGAGDPAVATVPQIFESSGDDTVASIDNACGSYYDRRAAELRDDKVRLEESRTERKSLESFARSRGIVPGDLHVALSALREHELVHSRRSFRGTEAPPPDAGYKAAFEQLVQHTGSQEKALALWERAQRGGEVVSKAVPTLATRAAAVRAISNPKILRFMAAFAEEK